MNRWVGHFDYNPLTPLLECGNAAIQTFVRRDLLDETVSVEDLWQLAEPQKILKKQKPNGAWIYPSAKGNIRTQENYNQIETYRNLGILVEEFGFNEKHPAIAEAAEYLLSFQSKEGDFRGIYGNQYSPNYSAGITELLVKVGYGNDARVKRVFEWLLSIRQEDAGWAIPFRTRNCNLDVETVGKPPSEHLFAQSIGRSYVQDRNRNEGQNAPEPACQAFAHVVEICRHDNSFIAVCRFW